MSNGNFNFDRFGKLLASLGKLVLDDKRHLESVCTLLQKLVFDATEWPTFKNWKAICALGRLDKLMMLVVGTLDLSRRDDQAKQIIAAFPECFGSEQMQGPIPLSLIRQKGIEGKVLEGGNVEHGADFPVSYGALKSFDLPQVELRTSDETDATELPMIPDTISANDEQGKVVQWEGRPFVIIENNRNGWVNIMTLVPAECIDVMV